MKRWRVKEVWKVKGWSVIDAKTYEEAKKKIEDGDGEFHEEAGTLEYWETDGDIEEAP